MEVFLQLGNVRWYHEYGASKEMLGEIISRFDLHELVEEDLLETTTQDKIDVYDQCMFIVLHFPKYKPDRNKYLTNEFNIILGKDYIITLSKYKTNHIDKIKSMFEQEMERMEGEGEHKTSPYYVLYRLIDVMHDKLLRAQRYFARDLSELEDYIFEYQQLDKDLLEQIMIRRRNVVALKHMVLPQREILSDLQEDTLKFYGGELEVYFEDLEYKLDKVINNINILIEDIESLYDTYNAIVSMKTNLIVTVLTIFTAVIGVMTLITGFYGMNVVLPGEQVTQMYWYILGGMALLAIVMVVFFKQKKWI